MLAPPLHPPPPSSHYSLAGKIQHRLTATGPLLCAVCVSACAGKMVAYPPGQGAVPGGYYWSGGYWGYCQPPSPPAAMLMSPPALHDTECSAPFLLLFGSAICVCLQAKWWAPLLAKAQCQVATTGQEATGATAPPPHPQPPTGMEPHPRHLATRKASSSHRRRCHFGRLLQRGLRLCCWMPPAHMLLHPGES
jgi:hypothetical protein